MQVLPVSGNVNYPRFPKWSHPELEISFHPGCDRLTLWYLMLSAGHQNRENTLTAKYSCLWPESKLRRSRVGMRRQQHRGLVPGGYRMLGDPPRWHQDCFSIRHHPQAWSRALGHSSTEGDVLFYSRHEERLFSWQMGNCCGERLC